MAEIQKATPDEIEIPENPNLEQMETLLEKLGTAIQNLSWREKLAFSKKNSPLFQKLEKIHNFCKSKWQEKEKGHEAWLALTGKFGRLREKFPVLYYRKILKL